MKHYTFTEESVEAFFKEALGPRDLADELVHKLAQGVLTLFRAWLQRQSDEGRKDLGSVVDDVPAWPIGAHDKQTFTAEEVLRDG